jgi:uncharacterized protein GlcG (DUF336 family)
MTLDLSLAEAREIIDRAVAKARDLKQAGAFVVMDAAGNPISISCIEGSPTSAVWVSRAKAYVSAVQREPSARRAENWHRNQVGFLAYQRLMRDEIFAGPGAMPIRKNGHAVGSLSTGGGVGPWTEIPGVDPSMLMVGDTAANAEDLIISHALQTEYANQHPDVQKLVGHRSDVQPDDLPHTLAIARGYADRVIAAARGNGVRVGVAIVDELGQLVQMDRMDGASPLAPDMAEAVARTALHFQCPTSEIEQRYSTQQIAQIQNITRHKLLTIGGGVPVVKDGLVVGAIGVCGGAPPEVHEAIARQSVAAPTSVTS